MRIPGHGLMIERVAVSRLHKFEQIECLDVSTLVRIDGHISILGPVSSQVTFFLNLAGFGQVKMTFNVTKENKDVIEQQIIYTFMRRSLKSKGPNCKSHQGRTTIG